MSNAADTGSPIAGLRTIGEHRAFGGTLGFYAHPSAACASEMRFAVYRPPAAEHGPVPVLWYLAGLTCTEETFMVKAGALRVAAELGLMLVAPDTSPRVRLPGDDASWDFGLGAGFYVDATQAPWSAHYRCYDWITRELHALVGAAFPAGPAQGIFGHSMGGHGALVMALRNPAQYRSVSAFAPISAPTHCPWGHKAFAGYLGDDAAAWREYDASALMAARGWPGPILVDQGLADKFLAEQLHPERLEAACGARNVALTLRRHAGYDHGYYFVQSFVEDHLRFHHGQLSAAR